MSKRTVVLVVAVLAVLIVFGVVRGQTYALDRPSLTATEVDGSILLEWSAVEGATRYGLWQWDCEDGWKMVGGREWETTQATHVDPVDERTYKYTVQALNDRGETSDWASRRENRYVWVRETVNPIPSPEFAIAQHSDRIELTFSAVEKAAGYRALVWYEGAGDRWLRMPEVDLETLTVSYYDVEPGVEYYFTMYAYTENRCGYSDVPAYQYVVYDPEPALPFTPTPPSGGAGGTGGDGTGGGTTGGDGTDDGGDDGNGVTGAVDTATPAHTATATATDVAPPGSTPTATATDSDVAPPGSTATPTPESRPRPGRVSITGAGSTHNSITVYWDVPDPPASEYVLRGGRDNNVKEVIYSGSATSFTWTGLDANTQHYFAVYGKNARGESGPFGYVKLVWTKVDPADLADYVPDAPTGLTAANTEDGVKLTWNNPTCTPTGRVCNNIDLGDVYEHQIDRRLGSNNRWQAIGQSGPGGRYTDKSARTGTTYTYRVRARNRHGLSEPSNSVTGSRGPTATPTATPAPPAKPGAPTVTTVFTSKIYQVSWGDLNDSSITRVIVLRREVRAGAVFTSIAERAPSGFGPNDLGNYIYTDSGVTCGVEYAYRIQARNAGGLSPQSSSTRVSSIIACPTATPDPCASANCNNECETTCCPNACEFCGPGPSIPALEFTAHYRLHLMLVHRDRAENRRLLQGHPYYTLHEVK